MAYNEKRINTNGNSGLFTTYGITPNPTPGYSSERFFEEEPAEIIDIIMDKDHPNYVSPEDIGKVRVNMFFSKIVSWARPIEKNIFMMPLLHEIVLTKYHIGYENATNNKIGSMVEKTLYYSTIINTLGNTNNNSMNNISLDTKSDNNDNSLGKKFKNNFNKFISPKYNEGDTFIKGRSGNSLLFTNTDGTGNYPLTILYNNYTNEEPRDITLDDFGSSISMWSGNKNKPTISLSNNSNINSIVKNNKLIFDDDVIFINSNQVLINSNNNDVIVTSGRNICLSSTNIIGIQSERINIFGSTIHLGESAREPAVLGKQLKKILRDIIKELIGLKVVTPSGPGTLNPTNITNLSNIMSNLEGILSEVLYIQ